MCVCGGGARYTRALAGIACPWAHRCVALCCWARAATHERPCTAPEAPEDVSLAALARWEYHLQEALKMLHELRGPDVLLVNVEPYGECWLVAFLCGWPALGHEIGFEVLVWKTH